MNTTGHATCMLCEAICGLTVDISDNRVVRIRGDDDDPFSRGHICPKGVALADIQHDPDRVRAPMRRRGAGWEQVGWDEALDDIADRLTAIRRAHGNDAVAYYYGNPTGHSYSAILYGLILLRALKTRNVYSANSVDALPRLLASLEIYGSQALLPIPDLDRTQYLLVLGANPLVSNGSIMTAPDCRRRLQALRERGGRLVVVNPRRTETAAIADEHHFIRPGGDAFLLLGMLHTLFGEGLVKVPPHLPIEGLERVTSAVAPFTPERVAAVCGIDAASVRRLARDFAAAPSAVCYGRLGTCTQAYGTTASWLVDVLNTVTGNLDRPGGAMFTSPAVDLAAVAARLGQRGSFDKWRSRVANLPEFNGETPVATFAAEMETPGEGQIRALILHAGNPVLSLPNGRRIDAAMQGLELVVAVDLYVNETTRHAHYLLPPTFGLEHDHYALLFHALSVRNTVKYSPALLAPGPDARHDWEILLGLATRLLSRNGLRGGVAAASLDMAAGAGPRRFLDLLLRLGPRGKKPFGRKGLTLAALEAHPHGIDLGPLEPRLAQAMGERAMNLAPERFLNDLQRLEAAVGGAAVDAGLLLIGRRTLRSNNSWMHNSERLVKGPERCTLLIHPDDARPRGLTAGDRARITSRVGFIEAPVQISDEVMRGVVSLPHGWGHGRDGARLAVAGRRGGVSLNDVTDEARIDPVSGTTDFNGVPVQVARA